MTHRRVSGLEWASECDRPGCIPRAKPRGAARMAGLRYERAVARALPMARHGQWFEFRDRHGPGWCQPDLIIRGRRSVLVVEVKYTWVVEGHGQIRDLYRPVIEWAWGLPVIGVVVVRNLILEMPVRVVRTLIEAIETGRAGIPVVVHWIGGPGLEPPGGHSIGRTVPAGVLHRIAA